MFNYLFKPECGHLVGHGTRTRKAKFPLGFVNLVEDVCFDYAPDDTLRVTVGWTHYIFKNVKREELQQTLEWFTTQSDEELEPYKKKRR